MAHLLFVVPPFHGHLGPSCALARTLAARGHQVTFATTIDGAARVQAAGLAAHVVGRASHPEGHLAADEQAMARVRGLAGLKPVVKAMASATDMLSRELPDVVRDLRIDAVVSDQLEAAGGLVARGLGLPYATLANALPINRGESDPPFFTPWRPARTAWERQRTWGAYRVADAMMADLGAVIGRHARAFGLGRLATPADLISDALDLAQMAPELEYPGLASRRLDFGPLRDRPSGGTRTGTSRKPLVYASLGTLFGGRADVFRAIVEATRGLAVELVVAHGGRLQAADLAPVPGHVRLERWVDQSEMLGRAALCITHAGMNTALDAAAAGVPMLAVPLAFDQPGIAARIAAAGLGLSVRPGPLLALRLRRAMLLLLDTPVYRERTTVVALSLAARRGVAGAADAIETRLLRRQSAPGAAPSAAP